MQTSWKQQLKKYFQKIKILKEKKITPFFGILKIRGGILLYSKNFLPVFKKKLGAGSGGQPNNFFFFWPNFQKCNLQVILQNKTEPFGSQQLKLATS